ncbi:M1 family metallopeptidase [Polaribacter glomeratus]|uniref:Peptidase M1 n=1 Tax=Polaribacter glomeratus TaxID=102 RepID=A0A2S7WJ61_9FLAO|nr:M1 family metallopeptidase [Polaribacter glomeratus]PQJ77630.1 peptidase M1 [Polaribacter glomeratus]TXD65216.1 M1 family metallopeptidase [Polaribacter glomeratus]
MKFFLSIIFSFVVFVSCSETKKVTYMQNDSTVIPTYWQQHVDYTMDIDMDVNKYQYKGKQKLVYTNNSPDELTKVFYHLYFNAFQPGSQMDVRSLNIADPDGRVKDRISKLKPNEIGYIKVNTLQQNGTAVTFETVGTILEVTLNKPIKSGERVTFNMDFDAQVPVQIRRSGRNSSEGIALSMAQWYPKMAEYDFQGWQTPPYIAREFQGVWGNFDVTLHIDKSFVVGGTGYLQNPQEIGQGYEDKSKELKLPKGDKLTWHFKAPRVHDFMWAADPAYIHDIFKMDNGIDLHFYYKKTLDEKYLEYWKELQPKTAELMKYYSEHVGQYPYKQYSVMQGGDGGMEYAMSTLITGQRSYGSLFGVTAHEMAHTWFQFLLASNESLHPWMDEGFTSYISNKAANEILKEGKENPHEGSYRGYKNIVAKGYEESLATHADRYDTNWAYSTASYSKGNIFLSQLEYVIGKENVAKGIKKYFIDFSFKHPTPNDIKRSMEKVSGIDLGWYLNEWTQTTHTIDYGIKSVEGSEITLERIGQMPMPIDVEVTYTDDTKQSYNIPLEMMRGSKPTTATLLKDWGWAYPTYSFKAAKTVKSVAIDTSKLMADVNDGNNIFEVK